MFFARSSPRRRPAFRPMVEVMEDRLVPSTSPIGVDALPTDQYPTDQREVMPTDQKPEIEVIMPTDQKAGDDYVSPGEKQGFNPQPDPPGIDSSDIPTDQTSADPPGVREGFNPQPDPPGVGDPFVGDPFVGDPFVGDPFRGG